MPASSRRCSDPSHRSPASTAKKRIKAANDTEYGLASYIYAITGSRLARRRIHRVGHGRRQSRRHLGCRGTVRRHQESGFGREGGVEGIEEYLDTKYIALTQ
jgi:succinate-semialdehyde dehydrogenase/glutarate-semialdehyde dehydrogenase